MADIIRCDVSGCGKEFVRTSGRSTAEGVDAYGIILVANRQGALVDVKNICDDCLEKGELRIQYVPNEVVHNRSPQFVEPQVVPPSVTTTATALIPEAPTPAELIENVNELTHEMKAQSDTLNPDDVKPPYIETIGERVKRLREERGWTLGRLSGFSVVLTPSLIEDIEQGRYKKPNQAIIDSLAYSFDISAKYLMTGKDDD